MALSPPSFHISISSRKWWWSRPLHNLKSSNTLPKEVWQTQWFLHALNFEFEIDGLVNFSGTGVTTALWNLNPLPLPCGQWKNIFNPITIFSGCVAKNNHEIWKQLANFLQFKQLKGAVTCQIQRAQKVLLKASNIHGVAVLSSVNDRPA